MDLRPFEKLAVWLRVIRATPSHPRSARPGPRAASTPFARETVRQRNVCHTNTLRGTAARMRQLHPRVQQLAVSRLYPMGKSPNVAGKGPCAGSLRTGRMNPRTVLSFTGGRLSQSPAFFFHPSPLSPSSSTSYSERISSKISSASSGSPESSASMASPIASKAASR